MKKFKEIQIAAIFFVGLVFISMITWALDQKVKKNTTRLATKEFPKKARVYDARLLEKFDELILTLDFSKNTFHYEGTFNVMDGKDSTNNVRDLKFLFCRSGKNYYSKLGNVETINQNGVNIYVEHDMKRVIVSQMAYPAKSPIRDLEKMIKVLKEEDYDLEGSVSGSNKKISLLNEHNISCKEISVTYDTVTNKLDNFLIRYTDFSDPGNDKKDRKIQVDFSKIETVGKTRNYPGIDDIIKDKNGKLMLLPKFSNYELIKL